MCSFFVQEMKVQAELARIGRRADDTLGVSVIAGSGYEMNAGTQTEHLGSEASVYTTGLR